MTRSQTCESDSDLDSRVMNKISSDSDLSQVALMIFNNVAFKFLTFWLTTFILNKILIENRFTSAKYAKFLSKRGLTIDAFQIKWYTVKCNRLFIKLSNFKPNFQKYWFNLGVILGMIGQFLSIILLIYTIYDFFKPKSISKQILVPVLPGVNLPSSQIWYYFSALFLCGIVHEFGHAVAASREQVRVNGFGVFLMFIFPGAYVDLCTEHIMVISPLRQLRIFCAGVWHNFVLVLVSLAIIQAHPYLTKHLFDKRVHVTSISSDSPLASSIKINSVITKIFDCDITNSYSYFQCLYKNEIESSSGFCISSNKIYKLASFTIETDKVLNECCNLNSSMTNYCFKWKQEQNSYGCLPARKVTEGKTCIKNCDQDICVFPISTNSTKLVRIEFDSEPAVLFVGSIKELIYTVFIDGSLPKYKFIPKFLNSGLILLLKYIVAFSGAIGILNLVPCFALDGQYILASLLAINKKSEDFTSIPQKRPFIYIIIIFFGTFLLLVNILLAFVSLTYSKFGYFFKD
ncbi:unnamed protein product [Brachionus calyciflorus]|uniref:Membrane-bound transcription factor site-2 protease n=1 Tax=Brachionus calyciflorus TaxID=104777 RepID=A0A814D7Y3_9BILA|nr:unnamed protein product [Brachionus calyciflorus]